MFLLAGKTQISGFEGLPLAHSLQTSPWVFGGLVLLLFIPLFVFSRSHTFMRDSFSLLFKEKNRQSIFSDFRVSNPLVRILLAVFFVFTLSIYAFDMVMERQTEISLLVFAQILAIVAAFVGLKILVIHFLTYVFFDAKTIQTTVINYLNILSISGLFIFPLLCLRIYSDFQWNFYFDIITVFILIFSILLIILKLFRLFFSKFIDLFYILLYLCTLEILPFAGLIRLFQMIE